MSSQQAPGSFVSAVFGAPRISAQGMQTSQCKTESASIGFKRMRHLDAGRQACNQAPAIWFHAANLGECSMALPALLRCLLECNVNYQEVRALLTVASWEAFLLLDGVLPSRVKLQLATLETSAEVAHLLQEHQPRVAVITNLAQNVPLIAMAAQMGVQVTLLSSACTGGQDTLRWHTYLMCRHLLWSQSLGEGTAPVPVSSLPEPTQLLLLCAACGGASAPGMAAVAAQISSMDASAGAFTGEGCEADERLSRQQGRRTTAPARPFTAISCCTVSIRAPRVSSAAAVATAVAAGHHTSTATAGAGVLGGPHSQLGHSAVGPELMGRASTSSTVTGGPVLPAAAAAVDDWEQLRRASGSSAAMGGFLGGVPCVSWPSLSMQEVTGALGSDGSMMEGWGGLLSFSPKAPVLSAPLIPRPEQAISSDKAGGRARVAGQEGAPMPDDEGQEPGAVKGLWAVLSDMWGALKFRPGHGHASDGNGSTGNVRQDGDDSEQWDLSPTAEEGRDGMASALAEGEQGRGSATGSASLSGSPMRRQQQQHRQWQSAQQAAVERLLHKVILDSWEVEDSPPGSPAQGFFTAQPLLVRQPLAVVAEGSESSMAPATGASAASAAALSGAASGSTAQQEAYSAVQQQAPSAHLPGEHHPQPYDPPAHGSADLGPGAPYHLCDSPPQLHVLRRIELPDPASPGGHLAFLTPVGGVLSPGASASIQGSVPASPGHLVLIQPLEGSPGPTPPHPFLDWSPDPPLAPGLRPHRQSFANWLNDGSPPQRAAAQYKSRAAAAMAAAAGGSGHVFGGDSPPGAHRPGSVAAATGVGARLETCEEAGESAASGPLPGSSVGRYAHLPCSTSGAGATQVPDPILSLVPPISPRKGAPATTAGAMAPAPAAPAPGTTADPIQQLGAQAQQAAAALRRRSLQEQAMKPWMPVNSFGDLISDREASTDVSDAENRGGRGGRSRSGSSLPPAQHETAASTSGGALQGQGRLGGQGPSAQQQQQQQSSLYLPPLRPIRALPVAGSSLPRDSHRPASAPGMTGSPPARSISMPPQNLLQLLQEEGGNEGDASSSPSTPRLLSRHSYQPAMGLAPVTRVRHPGGAGDQGSGEDIPDTPTSCLSSSSPFAGSVHDRPCPFALSRTGAIVGAAAAAGGSTAAGSARRQLGGIITTRISAPMPSALHGGTGADGFGPGPGPAGTGASGAGAHLGEVGGGGFVEEDIPDTPTSCMGNSSPFAGSAHDRPCPFSLSRTGSIVREPHGASRSAGGGMAGAEAGEAGGGTRRRASRFSEGDARQRGQSGSGAPAAEGGAPGDAAGQSTAHALGSEAANAAEEASHGPMGVAGVGSMHRGASHAAAHGGFARGSMHAASGADEAQEACEQLLPEEEPPTPMSCTGNMSPFADSVHDRLCPFSLSRTGSIVPPDNRFGSVSGRARPQRQGSGTSLGAGPTVGSAPAGMGIAGGQPHSLPAQAAAAVARVLLPPTDASSALLRDKERDLLRWACNQAEIARSDRESAEADSGAHVRAGQDRFVEPPSPRVASYVPPLRPYHAPGANTHAGEALALVPDLCPPPSAPAPGADPLSAAAAAAASAKARRALNPAGVIIPASSGSPPSPPSLHQPAGAGLSGGPDDLLHSFVAPVHNIVKPVLPSKPPGGSPSASRSGGGSTATGRPSPGPSPGQPLSSTSQFHHHMSYPSTASSMSVAAMAKPLHHLVPHISAPPNHCPRPEPHEHSQSPAVPPSPRRQPAPAPAPASTPVYLPAPHSTPCKRSDGAPLRAPGAAAGGALLRTVSEPSSTFVNSLTGLAPSPGSAGTTSRPPVMWPDSPPRKPPPQHPAVQMLTAMNSGSSAASSSTAGGAGAAAGSGSPPRSSSAAPTAGGAATPGSVRAPPGKPRKPQPGSPPRREPMLPTWSTPRDIEAPPSPRKRSLSGRPSIAMPHPPPDAPDPGPSTSNPVWASAAPAGNSAPDSPTSLSRRPSVMCTPAYHPGLAGPEDTTVAPGGANAGPDGYPGSPTHSVPPSPAPQVHAQARETRGKATAGLYGRSSAAAAAAPLNSALRARPEQFYLKHSATAAVAAATAAAAALNLSPSGRRRLSHADLSAMVAAATAAALGALDPLDSGAESDDASSQHSRSTAASTELPASAFASPSVASLLAGVAPPARGSVPLRASLLSRDSSLAFGTSAGSGPGRSLLGRPQVPAPPLAPPQPDDAACGTPARLTTPLASLSTPSHTPLGTLSSKYASPLRSGAQQRSPYRKLFMVDGGLNPRNSDPEDEDKTDDVAAASRKRLFLDPEDEEGGADSAMTEDRVVATCLSGGITPAALAAAAVALANGTASASDDSAGEEPMPVWKPSFVDDEEAQEGEPGALKGHTSLAASIGSAGSARTPPAAPKGVANGPLGAANGLASAAPTASPGKPASRSTSRSAGGGASVVPSVAGTPLRTMTSGIRAAGAGGASSCVQSPYRKLFADSDEDAGAAARGGARSGSSGATPSRPRAPGAATPAQAPAPVDLNPQAGAGLHLQPTERLQERSGVARSYSSGAAAAAQATAAFAAQSHTLEFKVGARAGAGYAHATARGSGPSLRSHASVPITFAPAVTGLEGLEHLITPLKLPLTPRSAAAELAAGGAGSSGSAGQGGGLAPAAFAAGGPVAPAPSLPAPSGRHNSLQQQAVTRAGWAAVQQQQQQQQQQQGRQLQPELEAGGPVAPGQALGGCQAPDGSVMAVDNPLFYELERIKDQLKDVECLLAGQHRPHAGVPLVPRPHGSVLQGDPNTRGRSSGDAAGAHDGERAVLRSEVQTLRQQVQEMAGTMRQQQELLAHMQALLNQQPGPMQAHAVDPVAQRLQQKGVHGQRRGRRTVDGNALKASASSGASSHLLRNLRCQWSATHARSAPADVASNVATAGSGTAADTAGEVGTGSGSPTSSVGSSSDTIRSAIARAAAAVTAAEVKGVLGEGRQKRLVDKAPVIGGDTEQHGLLGQGREREQTTRVQEPREDTDIVRRADGGAGDGDDAEGGTKLPFEAEVKPSTPTRSVGFILPAEHDHDRDEDAPRHGGALLSGFSSAATSHTEPEEGLDGEPSLAMPFLAAAPSTGSMGSAMSLGQALSLGPVDALPDGAACAWLAEQPPDRHEEEEEGEEEEEEEEGEEGREQGGGKDEDGTCNGGGTAGVRLQADGSAGLPAGAGGHHDVE